MPMHRRPRATRATAAAAAVLLFLTAAHAQDAARRDAAVKPAALSLAPCQVPGVTGEARCGTHEVFENRTTNRGRKINLKVVVLPATGQNRAPDPYFYLAGGPGSAATEEAGGLAREFALIRERRDIVLVDQRGTGSSNPLNCKFFDPSDMQSHFGYFFPLEDVRKCRAQLEPKADLSLYTTPIAADDLDDVRAALGYEQINVIGGSYGTRAAMVYMKRHPHRVRTVTLHGVAPTNQFMPRDFPQDTERALNGILGECETDAACRSTFPNLRAEARAVLARLVRAPVEVEVLHPKTGERTIVKLPRELAAEAVRYMLYHPGAAKQIPLFLHLAAQGDYTPLAESALFYRREIVASDSNGMYLSVTCAEDLPSIKPGEGERNAADTLLGDYRLRQQREACALWPRSPLPADYAEPVRSDTPVLILSGEWDPVTPPSNGDAVAKHFPNSLHVVVPHGGHGFGGLEGVSCIQRLSAEFVERGAAKGLDAASCVSAIRRKGFLLNLPGMKTVTMADAELAKFAGRYAAQTDPTEVKIEAQKGKLGVSLFGEQMIFAPVSPTQFRAAGSPGFFLTFEVVGGQVTRLVVERFGSQLMTLQPKKT